MLARAPSLSVTTISAAAAMTNAGIAMAGVEATPAPVGAIGSAPSVGNLTTPASTPTVLVNASCVVSMPPSQIVAAVGAIASEETALANEPGPAALVTSANVVLVSEKGSEDAWSESDNVGGSADLMSPVPPAEVTDDFAERTFSPAAPCSLASDETQKTQHGASGAVVTENALMAIASTASTEMLADWSAAMKSDARNVAELFLVPATVTTGTVENDARRAEALLAEDSSSQSSRGVAAQPEAEYAAADSCTARPVHQQRHALANRSLAGGGSHRSLVAGEGRWSTQPNLCQGGFLHWRDHTPTRRDVREFRFGRSEHPCDIGAWLVDQGPLGCRHEQTHSAVQSGAGRYMVKIEEELQDGSDRMIAAAVQGPVLVAE